MAKKQPQQPEKTPAKKPGKTLAKWQDELAKQAQAAADMEQSSGGHKYFSMRAGQLSFDDAKIPGNEMAVVILDAVLENAWYAGEYDPEVAQSPACFAFGRVEKEMTPHDEAVDKQASECDECPLNKFGSAEKGRGKACRNSRRLALIPAGTSVKGELQLFDDEDHFKTAGIAFMKLPPTSIRAFGAFVKSVASGLRRPPHGVFTRIWLEPDDNTQFRVNFEVLEEIPDELIETIMARHEEAVGIIEHPYQPVEDDGDRKSRGKSAGKAKAGKPAPRRAKY